MVAEIPAALRILRSAVASGRWDRPFLLLGRGEERDAAARAAAKAVLCAGRPEGSGEPCGSCGACGRFDRGLHPDFHEAAPAKGRVSIGVDVVETILSRISLRPVEGRGAAVLVAGAETLTDQAQNALLKTLEEPPPRTAFLLTAAAARSLLPTVRSRCAVLRLPPLPADALLRLAREGGREAGVAGVLVAAAAGDPETLSVAADEGLPGAAAPLARAFAPRPGRGPAADPHAGLPGAVAWVKGRGGTLEEQRGRLRLALRLLLSMHAPGGASVLPGDLAAAYNALPAGARRVRLAALCEARERVERFVDPAGILEALAAAVAAADR